MSVKYPSPPRPASRAYCATYRQPSGYEYNGIVHAPRADIAHNLASSRSRHNNSTVVAIRQLRPKESK